MLSTTLSDFRKETKQYLDKVTNERETLIINRGKDTGVVIISLEEYSWNEYLFWQKNDKQKLNKINELLKDISRSPYEGIGKPEALKFKFAGYWSRRIDEEHRLIYKVVDDEIFIFKCRFHYD